MQSNTVSPVNSVRDTNIRMKRKMGFVNIVPDTKSHNLCSMILVPYVGSHGGARVFESNLWHIGGSHLKYQMTGRIPSLAE